MSATATERHLGCDPSGHRHAPVVLDLSRLRLPGGLMLVLAVLLPLLPGHPGLPCPLRTLTGIPCPACGMTTSVEAAVRLDLSDAWAANPMGIVAVAVALTVLLVRRPLPVRMPVPAVGATLAAMWLFQLVRFGIV